MDLQAGRAAPPWLVGFLMAFPEAASSKEKGTVSSASFEPPLNRQLESCTARRGAFTLLVTVSTGQLVPGGYS